MKYLIQLLLVLFTSQSFATDAPLRLSQSYNSDYRGTSIDMVALENSVIIQKVVVNRGNCAAVPGGAIMKLPVEVRYGERFYMLTKCQVLEVQVMTNHGGFTYSF